MKTQSQPLAIVTFISSVEWIKQPFLRLCRNLRAVIAHVDFQPVVRKSYGVHGDRALCVAMRQRIAKKIRDQLPDTLRILMTSGLLPAAFIAIVLNLLLPEDLDGSPDIAGGLSGDN